LWAVRTILAVENFCDYDINKIHVKELERNIILHITADGHFPSEMKRQKGSLFYHGAALQAITTGIEIVKNVTGKDFYKHPDVRLALQFYWANGYEIRENWKYQLSDEDYEQVKTWKASLFVAMGYVYGRQQWVDWQDSKLNAFNQFNRWGLEYIAESTDWVCPHLLQPQSLVDEPVDPPPVIEPSPEPDPEPTPPPVEDKIVKIIVPDGVKIEIEKISFWKTSVMNIQV